MKRPGSITAVAWITIVIGISGVLSSGMFWLICLIGILSNLEGFLSSISADTSAIPQTIKYIILLHELIQFVAFAVCIFITIAGIYFLKLRAWARTGLEIVSWSIIIFMVGYGIFAFLIGWLGLIPRGNTSPVAVVIVVNMAVLILLINGIPLGLNIWFLRSKTVREAIKANNP